MSRPTSDRGRRSRPARRGGDSVITRACSDPMVPAPTNPTRGSGHLRPPSTERTAPTIRSRSSWPRSGCTGSDRTSVVVRAATGTSAGVDPRVVPVAVVVEHQAPGSRRRIPTPAACSDSGELVARDGGLVGRPAPCTGARRGRGPGSSCGEHEPGQAGQPGRAVAAALRRRAADLVGVAVAAGAGRPRPAGRSSGSCCRPSRTGSARACPGCAAPGAGRPSGRRRW